MNTHRWLNTGWIAVTASLLAGCTPQTPVPIQMGTVSGTIVAPGGIAVFSQPASGRSVHPVSWKAPHVEGQVLITQANTLSAQSLGHLNTLGAESIDSGLWVVSTPAGMGDATFAERLEQQGFTVQPNYLYKSLGNASPNDPSYNRQGYLQQMNVPGAWELLNDNTFNPSPVKVAVLDTGFDINHPELQNRLMLSEAKDFCSKRAPNCSTDPADRDVQDEPAVPDRGHGTSSVGLISAKGNNATGISGITWSGANILPLKVFGGQGNNYGADTVSLRAALSYATTQNVKVINMSLGIPLYDRQGNPNFDDLNNPDPIIRSALSTAETQNILVVASAGNTIDDGIYYPASEPSVLAVGAVGANDTLWTLGSRVGSARPREGQKSIDLVAPGVDIYSLTVSGYNTWTGTSEAAPMVSGIAALLYADKPDATVIQIVNALKGSARKPTGYSARTYGGGVVNAKAALQKLRNPQNPDPTGCTAPNARHYPVVLEAFQGNQKIKTINVGDICSGESQINYNIGLPYGRYTLKATMTSPGGQTEVGRTDIVLERPLLTQQDISLGR